jgi:hypothetical protein
MIYHSINRNSNIGKILAVRFFDRHAGDDDMAQRVKKEIPADLQMDKTWEMLQLEEWGITISL